MSELPRPPHRHAVFQRVGRGQLGAARRPHGIALIETLLAVLVLGVGMASLLKLQTNLWGSADTSREKIQAQRRAQSDIETVRGIASIDTGAAAGGPSAPSEFAITGQAAISVNTLADEPAFTFTREVSTLTTPALKAIATTLQWADRHGAARSLSLSTLVDAADPRWSAWLTLAPGGGSAPGLTPPTLPIQAHDLGDGRVAVRPFTDQPLVWILDATLGVVTQRCTAPLGIASALLRSQHLSACTATSGLLLSGTVRFATTQATVNALDAAHPLGPLLPLQPRLILTSPAPPASTWTCLNDAPTAMPADPTAAPTGLGTTGVHLWCLIQPGNTPAKWSGRLDLLPTGWTLAATATDADPTHYRVCRYSADTNGNGRMDNAEHPAAYSQVDGPLNDQNFLVIRASASCPVDTSVTRSGADVSTVAHQP